MLERRHVVEVLWCLHCRYVGIIEIPERMDKKVGSGHMVSVEDGDVLCIQLPERVVKIPCLRVLVGWPSEIASTELDRECSYLRPIAVVEDPGLSLVTHRAGCRDRRQQRLDILVVGRDQHRYTFRAIPTRPSRRQR